MLKAIWFPDTFMICIPTWKHTENNWAIGYDENIIRFIQISEETINYRPWRAIWSNEEVCDREVVAESTQFHQWRD